LFQLLKVNLKVSVLLLEGGLAELHDFILFVEITDGKPETRDG